MFFVAIFRSIRKKVALMLPDSPSLSMVHRFTAAPGTVSATKESFVKCLQAKINIPCQAGRVCSTGACSPRLLSCCPLLSF